MNPQETPQEVHKAFCACTGTQPNYRVHERAYVDYLSYGYTAADLILVLKHLLHENRRMNGAAYSLRIDKLLDFEYRHFDAVLSEARAVSRNRRGAPTPKQVVQSQREQVIDPEQASTMTTTTIVPVKQILKEAIAKL